MKHPNFGVSSRVPEYSTSTLVFKSASKVLGKRRWPLHLEASRPAGGGRDLSPLQTLATQDMLGAVHVYSFSFSFPTPPP